MIRARSGKTAARLALGAGVLALAIPALAGCEAGQGAPTLEYHQAAAGAQANVDGIQISDAFVLGGPTGSALPAGSSAGLFLSIYNSGSGSDTLVKATAAGTAGSVTLPGGTVDLPANAAPVDLTGPQPEVVLEGLTKPVSGGSYIPVTLDFQHAGSVTFQVPVEPHAYYWSTYSQPATTTPATTAPATTPATTAPASPSATPTTPTPSATAS